MVPTINKIYKYYRWKLLDLGSCIEAGSAAPHSFTLRYAAPELVLSRYDRALHNTAASTTPNGGKTGGNNGTDSGKEGAVPTSPVSPHAGDAAGSTPPQELPGTGEDEEPFIDHTADVFSFGLVIYEAATGRKYWPPCRSDYDVVAALVGAEPLPSEEEDAFRRLFERYDKQVRNPFLYALFVSTISSS
jgi:hypothetical protein